MNPFKTLGRFGLDTFLLLLFAAAGLSMVAPDIGKSGGLIHLDLYSNYGVSVVFLLYGLTLSWDRLRAGMLNWRLHLVVLSGTFVIYPALVWGATAASGSLLGSDLKLGFCFGRVVSENDPMLLEKGQALEARFGRKALVDLALVVALARFSPTVKRALGHSRTCAEAKVTV